jgi:hypothetical protein
MARDDDTERGAELFGLSLELVEHHTAVLRAALARVDYAAAWHASRNVQDALGEAERLARSEAFGGAAAVAQLAVARALAEPLIAVAPDPRLVPEREQAARAARWRMGLGGVAQRHAAGGERLMALVAEALTRPMTKREMLRWLSDPDDNDEPEDGGDE